MPPNDADPCPVETRILYRRTGDSAVQTLNVATHPDIQTAKTYLKHWSEIFRPRYPHHYTELSYPVSRAEELETAYKRWKKEHPDATEV